MKAYENAKEYFIGQKEHNVSLASRLDGGGIRDIQTEMT